MKIFWAVLVFILHHALCIVNSTAQNPLVKMWDYRYGGTGYDYFTCLTQTTDGCLLLGGFSSSPISGDKTQDTIGKFDYWIIKIDSNGNKLWDQDLGGPDDDLLYSIIQTKDGGYLLGGTSYSGNGGSKSEASFDTSLNYFNRGDYWIIKLDSIGNKEWDKTFGGNYVEENRSLLQTGDGGYLIGGFSYSGASGNKTQTNWDTLDPISSDYWILKLDSSGNKQWEKVFGGTSYDHLLTVLKTNDDGFILGGESESGISGNNTQGACGSTDYWIIKIDSLGNFLWDKTFGGADIENFLDVINTSDNGYIIEGVSHSGISGNKTQPNWDPSGNTGDYWMVKIDSLGNKLWERDYGGTSMEDGDLISKISSTLDGGYLLSGNSYSQLSGDKTENNLGTEQTWIIKTDLNGIKQWDKTIFTLGHDESASVTQTEDGCYIIANCTGGGIGGYKTQPLWGNFYNDYWIVKFCDTTFIHSNFFTSSTICSGRCIDFINLSINGLAYQWNFTGASPDTSTSINPSTICYPTPGSYSVTLIASNANGSDTLTLQNYITVFPQPSLQSITQSGDTLFAIAGSASYQWYYNGSIIAGATNYFHVAQASGDYNVVATDSNGCEVEAVINNVSASNKPVVDCGPIIIFPNPVQDRFTMHNAQCMIGTAIDISVYNTLGEKMYPEFTPLSLGEGPDSYRDGTSSSASIWGPLEADCRLFPSGIYYLEIRTDDRSYRAKFIKQ